MNWERVNIDEQELERIRRLGDYDEFTTELPKKTPYRRCFDDLDRPDSFNNLLCGDLSLAVMEINKKSEPEIIDFVGQMMNLREGISILNNLNVLELHFMHNTKEYMQEAMFDLERNIGYEEILKDLPQFYDNS